MTSPPLREHLETLEQRCVSYQHAHVRSAAFYQGISVAISFPLIGLNGTLSALNSLDALPSQHWAMTTVLVVNALFLAAKEVARPDRRSEFHSHLSAAYGKLGHEIRSALLTAGSPPDETEKFRELVAKYASLLDTQTEFGVPRFISSRLASRGAEFLPVSFRSAGAMAASGGERRGEQLGHVHHGAGEV